MERDDFIIHVYCLVCEQYYVSSIRRFKLAIASTAPCAAGVLPRL